MAELTKTFLLRMLVTLSLAALANCTRDGLSASAKRDREVAVIVDATELAGAFEENEQNAIRLFGGKRARIQGTFARSEPLADGNFALSFKTSAGTFRPVRCVMEATDSIALNRLSTGDELTITGTIAGFTESSYFITVEDCSIEEKWQE